MNNWRPMDESLNRRQFLGNTMAAAAGLAALSVSGCSESTRRSAGQASAGFVGKGDVVLFQGDSITDAGRDRKREDNANDKRALGGGYALLHLVAPAGRARRRGPEDLQPRHQRQQGLPTRRTMGQGLHRAEAQPPQHPDRRQRHLAQAQRPVRRHGRSLRERLSGPPGADETRVAGRAAGDLRALRAPLRGRQRQVVPRIRRLPGRRQAGGDRFRRRVRPVPVGVRRGGPEGPARPLGRRRRSSHHRRCVPDGAEPGSTRYRVAKGLRAALTGESRTANPYVSTHL